MNETAKLIFIDLAEHPDSSIAEIAARVFICYRQVAVYIHRYEKAFIIKSEPARWSQPGQRGGRTPARYRLIDGHVNWCPHCGHIMEKVGR